MGASAKIKYDSYNVVDMGRAGFTHRMETEGARSALEHVFNQEALRRGHRIDSYQVAQKREEFVNALINGSHDQLLSAKLELCCLLLQKSGYLKA